MGRWEKRREVSSKELLLNEERGWMTYKPDSVLQRSFLLCLNDHFSGIRVASNLKRPTRRPRPGQPVAAFQGMQQLSSYLVLHRATLTVPVMSPSPRWALTPPFHPGLPPLFPGEAGGLFSVALSFAFPRPGVTRHRALRSSDFPPVALRRLDSLSAYRSSWFATGDRQYGIDAGEPDTGSLAPQWAGCVSWGR